MKNIFFVLIVIALCFASMGFGYIFGGTNLSFTGYPAFSKIHPSAPWSHEEWAYRSYKMDTEQYIDDAKTYVENAQNDMKRIRAAIEEAIEKSNEAVEEYNSWVRRDY